MRVSIGIYIDSHPERLEMTLASLRANTIQPIDIVLLVDGPMANEKGGLEKCRDCDQLKTAVSTGAPYCFNRLLTHTRADLYIFIENGVIVGPEWFDYMLATLKADPKNGLVGPSTNRAWNEQGVFPRAKGNLTNVLHTAAAAAARFGTKWQTLTPLYSLGDFCFAVKKEVVATIGGADEAYGLGPCWEMDYSIRAARAGFQAVWAQGAYVYRQPPTLRRRRQEAQLYTSNKHLYQDRFCGRRLRDESAIYKSHCQGDVCCNFAPSDLIQTIIPLPFKSVCAGDSIAEKVTKESRNVAELAQERFISASNSDPAPSLVSCIMPTRDRPDFAMQAVHYFLQQDYPERELIIVDDSVEEWHSRLPDDPRICFLRVSRDESIGAKRNRACAEAHGEIIVHWDDDDWYAPHRLRAQVEPLLSGKADISGLTGTIFFELDTWRFWSCERPLHKRLFVENVHGGTLAYRRHVWQQMAKFPDRSLAEDALFLRRAVRRGARLHRLPNEGLFLYLRHQTNSWSFTCGHYLNPGGWHQIAEPNLPELDRAFYAKHSQAMTAQILDIEGTSAPHLHKLPLVSCIMPTANRRAFITQAINCFLQQDYSPKELIVVDDGTDPVADLIPDDKRIRYLRLEKRESIGAKRNFACQQARGDIIGHWDDDDWAAPWRLNYQIAELTSKMADVCGLATVYYLSETGEEAWQYIYPENGRAWVAGNTLCYTKAFWQHNPFPAINVGEDTRFIWSRKSKHIVQLADPTFFVGLIHEDNVSPKRLTGSRWRKIPVADVLNIMNREISRRAPLDGRLAELS